MKHAIDICLSFCLLLSQEVLAPTFAAVNQTSQDAGNLNLTTQTPSYKDISNRDSSTNMSALVNVSESDVQDKAGKTHPETSTTGSVGFGFSDSHQLSKATIGQGTIKAGGQCTDQACVLEFN